MHFKILGFIFCFLLSQLCSKAQSLYHIQYKLAEDSTAYNAFLVFYEDGTGLMRLRYTRNSNDLVVEADAVEKPVEPGAAADSSDTFFDFINQRIIAGKNSEAILLPQIRFTINRSSGFAEPSALVVQGPAQATQLTSRFTANHISMPELQKKFLLQFYSEDEDFYRSIFQTVTRGLSALEKKTNMHLLIVANTKEKIIGGSCALDKERTLQTFSELSKYLGIRLMVDSVAGNNYSKKSVEDAIKKLRPTPQDIVVFYYSGHGYRKPGGNSRYPSIDLRAKPSDDHVKQSLGMEEIYNIIKKKGARTTLVLSDCCNNDVTSRNIIASKPLKTKSSGIPWSEENIRALFFSKVPVALLATSADSGEKASGNEKLGGFFSYFFKGSMESYCSKLKSNPTWDVVLATAKMQTIHKASKTYCEKPYIPANICKQSPFYTVEIGR